MFFAHHFSAGTLRRRGRRALCVSCSHSSPACSFAHRKQPKLVVEQWWLTTEHQWYILVYLLFFFLILYKFLAASYIVDEHVSQQPISSKYSQWQKDLHGSGRKNHKYIKQNNTSFELQRNFPDQTAKDEEKKHLPHMEICTPVIFRKMEN